MCDALKVSNKKWHELEMAQEKSLYVQLVLNVLMLTVQNEFENITLLFVNIKNKG